jgi:hypothetical protein
VKAISLCACVAVAIASDGLVARSLALSRLARLDIARTRAGFGNREALMPRRFQPHANCALASQVAARTNILILLTIFEISKGTGNRPRRLPTENENENHFHFTLGWL